ncbi:MAG: hypothetical protein ABSD87_11710 [Candidatus Acidiferrales bacterium]|jgi:hypothetical protein
MSKRKQILVWAATSFAVLVAYACLFGVQTGFAFIAWRWGRQMPVTKTIPVDLTDLRINPAAGTNLTYLGFSFEIPWSDVVESKTVGKMQLVRFRSGMVIIISRIPPRAFVTSVAEKAGGEQDLKRAYGDEVTSSDYNFYQMMLNTTPKSVKPFGSRQAATRSELILLIKAIAVPEPGESGIFSLRTSHFEGFQYGNPGVNPKRILIDLFDELGGTEIMVACGATGCSPPITQADLNRISQSLVRVVPYVVMTSTPTTGNPKLTASR